MTKNVLAPIDDAQFRYRISPSTIQKLIKVISGKTFLSYVESQRLEKAHEILATGKYKINEVAVQCGFSKVNSFYKAYKRTYGISPSVTVNKSVMK